MRENKFKCWDKKLNKWVDIFTLKIGVQLTDVGFAMSTGWDSEDNPTWDFSKVEFDRYEYPQSTGLLDKNGKKIYEGDILKNEFGEKVVKWDQGGFYLDEKRTIMRIYFWSIDLSKIEVIGNLYENPELLV